MAKISTLTDTFATLDAAKFTPGGTAGPPAAVASIVSGALRLEYPNTAGSHCEYTSVARNWDLTASSIMVEIPDAGPQQTGWETWLFLGSGATSFDYNNYLGIAINAANGVLAELNNGGGGREVGVGLGAGTYNATAHRWLQIRETSGTIFWEYSATGAAGSWTTLHSVASTTATFSLTTLFVELYVAHTTAAGAVGYSTFDNLNLPPGGAGNPKMETLTDTFASGLPGTWGSNNTSLVTASGGGIRLDHAANTTYTFAYPSAGVYGLTASYAMVEITDFDSSAAAQERGLEVTIDAANNIGLYASAGELRGYSTIANVVAQLGTAITLDTTAHRWFRIREAGGTIFLDTSPTSTGTWTNRFSVANPFAVTAMFPRLGVGNYSGTASGYAVFDNLNVAAAAPASSGWQLGLSARGGPVDTPTPPPSGTAFPLLGGLLTAGPQDYDNTTYQAQIAKLDVGILGMYPGWGTLAARQAAVNAIKAINPGIKLGNYTSVNEIDSSASNMAALRTKLSSESSAGGRDWYLYLANGTTHASGFAGQWSINLSLTSTTPGSDGDRWPQYKAKWDKTNLFDGVDFDIQHSDNCFEDPPIDADWDCDGVLDGVTSTTVRNTMRDGYRAHYDTVKSVQPTKILMANTDTDMKGDVYPGGLSIPQYTNVVHGVLLEQLTGQTWSVEVRTPGWAGMMSWYHAVFNNILAPKMVLFNWGGFAAGTAGYQTHRYMFASCLLDNGYYCASNTSYHDVLWFDEFDLNGTASTKWLGAAIDPPPTTAWSSGVYRREFENGLALANPKGNGSRTVSIGTGWHKVAGSRDAVNNGATVTSVTLADRDGLILVRS